MDHLALWLQLFAAILASIRLTESFLFDTVWTPLRHRTPWFPWACPRCLSVWAGGVCTVFYLVEPWLNWPLLLSWVYFILVDYKAEYLKRTKEKTMAETNGKSDRPVPAPTSIPIELAIIGRQQVDITNLQLENQALRARIDELTRTYQSKV